MKIQKQDPEAHLSEKEVSEVVCWIKICKANVLTSRVYTVLQCAFTDDSPPQLMTSTAHESGSDKSVDGRVVVFSSTSPNG